MRSEAEVTAYLLSLALLLSIALLKESELSKRAVALFLVVLFHFVMLCVNIYFFSTDKLDNNYAYDRDFGRYWRWA